MRGTSRWLVAVAVVPMLTQACATMEGPPSVQTIASAPAQGTPSYGIAGSGTYFKVEWAPDERRGQPMVSGYVTNTSGFSVRKVRLQVEALDAAGAVTATYMGYVNGDVTAGARLYYEVAVGAKAPSYRVSVLSFEQVQGFGP